MEGSTGAPRVAFKCREKFKCVFPVGPGVVGVVRDLHSFEIFLHLTRSEAGDDKRAGTELCLVPYISATVSSDSSESSAHSVAEGSLSKSPASHSSSFAGMCSSSVFLALCRVLSSSPTQGESQPMVGELKLVPGQCVGDAEVNLHVDFWMPLDPDLDKGFFRSIM